MLRSPQPINWNAIASGKTHAPVDPAVLWAERTAIEMERLAIQEAVERAIRDGSAKPIPRWEPEPTILSNPYLPAVCTILMLGLAIWLQYP